MDETTAQHVRVGDYVIVKQTPSLVQVVYVTNIREFSGRATGSVVHGAWVTGPPSTYMIALTGPMRTMHFNGRGGYLESGTRYLDGGDPVTVVRGVKEFART